MRVGFGRVSIFARVSETVETRQPEAEPPEELTERYASLLASGERIALVRQRHWLTFLEAGRWFALALGCGILLLALGQQFGDDGVSGFFSTLLDWGFWIFLTIGILGVGWYYLVWRVERYIVTTRRVIEAGGVINKYTRDTTLSMITDMLVGHPWLGRIVGYGEIDLLTGNEQGTSKIRFLPDADGFKKALLDAKHEYEMEVGGGRVLQEAMTAAASTPPAAPPLAPVGMSAEEVDSSLSRLADMRDRGLITHAEFDEKKKQLLDRL
jgi:Short C-terminal domain/Bacterial PH domain